MCASAGDQTHNLRMCLDQGSNSQPFGALDNIPTSWATWPGQEFPLLTIITISLGLSYDNGHDYHVLGILTVYKFLKFLILPRIYITQGEKGKNKLLCFNHRVSYVIRKFYCFLEE